ncbi:hypothetical protein ACFLUJ_09125, partial [Chloroflexota bacterium]
VPKLHLSEPARFKKLCELDTAYITHMRYPHNSGCSVNLLRRILDNEAEVKYLFSSSELANLPLQDSTNKRLA